MFYAYVRMQWFNLWVHFGASLKINSACRESIIMSHITRYNPSEFYEYYLVHNTLIILRRNMMPIVHNLCYGKAQFKRNTQM